jgi:hypothetical protein
MRGGEKQMAAGGRGRVEAGVGDVENLLSSGASPVERREGKAVNPGVRHSGTDGARAAAAKVVLYRRALPQVSQHDYSHEDFADFRPPSFERRGARLQ